MNDHDERAEASSSERSRLVERLPHLSIDAFRRIAQPVDGLVPWASPRERRRGFEAGFEGARILIPRGFESPQMRLRAAYTEAPLTFRDIIQAILIAPGEETTGKLLTALLNSRVALWYAFHGTSSFGSDRPEVQQAELLRLPFPRPTDLADVKRAERAAAKLVAIVDAAVSSAQGPFALRSDDDELLAEIDRLAYEYFGLSDEEVILIDDATERIIPAVQPRAGSYPDLWREPDTAQRHAYVTTLVENLNDWLRSGYRVSARLEACDADLGVLRLSIDKYSSTYTEAGAASFTEVLSKLSAHIGQSLGGNIYLLPDLRVFIEDHLYLIKPMQLRFWLRATALADADAVAMDLQDVTTLAQLHNEY